MTLEDFETLVLTQQPASTPWAPVTDYSFEARKAIEGPHATLIIQTFKPSSIVDVGCGYGYLEKMLRDVDPDCVITGVDKHTGFDLGRTINLWPFADLVICREVLEHLTMLEIRQAVPNLCKMARHFVYVTTRFHPNPDSLLDVATSDDLDPTHISMLNSDFLRCLFVLEGFKRRADLEQHMDWKQLGRVLVYERA